MNEHQLLCFLTVSRTLNFSAAARELYCPQPALSYQIRSLEKELDAALFRRTTTQVALTEAGRALLPHAEDLYRGILNARTALKGFGTHHTLTLRLPPVLLQRDPIYPILMARLHAALPGYEFKVDTTPVPSSYHHMLSALAGQQIFYEPLYQDMVDFARKQPGMPYSTPVWRMVENYESVYAELLAGRGMFLCPMIYPAFPAGWHIPLHLSIPDTRLLTLRDDPRPEICTLRKVFAEVYTEREKLIKAL